MFESAVLDQVQTRRPGWIACALATQLVAVSALAMLPLASIEKINLLERVNLLPPRSLPSEPEVLRPVQTSRMAAFAKPRFAVLPESAPLHPYVPRQIDLGPDPNPILFPDASRMPPGNFISGADPLERIIGSTIPPRVPSAQQPDTEKPLRIPSSVSQSQILYGPKPIYPHLALTARVEGTVRLQAVISREGRIEELRVLSGSPLLAGAALDAVRQWRYRPLLLNGQPVEIITEISVVFTLRR